MKNIGIDKYRINYIPWGVKPNDNKLVGENKKSKLKLLLPINKPLFLWAGYIQ